MKITSKFYKVNGIVGDISDLPPKNLTGWLVVKAKRLTIGDFTNFNKFFYF